MKNSYFYSPADIKKIKSLIRTGKSLTEIAREHHQEFNAPFSGFYVKVLKLSKTTRKLKSHTPETKTEGIAVPEGVSLDFTSKRVTMHNDHVRIYF